MSSENHQRALDEMEQSSGELRCFAVVFSTTNENDPN
jgi:hypothetical protein